MSKSSLASWPLSPPNGVFQVDRAGGMTVQLVVSMNSANVWSAIVVGLFVWAGVYLTLPTQVLVLKSPKNMQGSLTEFKVLVRAACRRCCFWGYLYVCWWYTLTISTLWPVTVTALIQRTLPRPRVVRRSLPDLDCLFPVIHTRCNSEVRVWLDNLCFCQV